MPKIKSAKKALRQNVRRRAQNVDRKKKMSTTIKQFKKLVVAGGDEAKQSLSQVYATLDKLAKVGFIKKNKASRLKSRLAKKLAIKK